MKNFSLLKTLLPGFLPLLAYILVEAFLGTVSGLIAALGIAVAEILFTFIREHKLDRFVLADFILILLLGGISLFLDNPLFFKLKPAVIEGLLCLLLGMNAFTRYNPLAVLTGRYLKGAPQNREMKQSLTRMSRPLFFLILFHTGLIIYAAFFLSDAAWGFISGVLFYLLLPLIPAYSFLRRKCTPLLWKMRYRNDEWLCLVDQKGYPVGSAPRTVCHNGSHLLHPVIHLHLFNPGGDLYLQKRAENKRIQPGKWDTSVGGHIEAGESLQKALRREVWEELGLSGIPSKQIFCYLFRSEIESEIIHAFLAVTDEEPRPNPEEISEGRFWSLEEIEENKGKGLFTPQFEQEFTLLMQYTKKEAELKAAEPRSIL